MFVFFSLGSVSVKTSNVQERDGEGKKCEKESGENVMEITIKRRMFSAFGNTYNILLPYENQNDTCSLKRQTSQ